MKRIRLYGNTGFNSVDVPDSLALIKSRANKIKDLSNYNIIQTNNLARITIDDITEEECQKIDYVIVSEGLQETGYILADNRYEFRADGTAVLYLIRDALATIGEIDDDILKYATANRMSVADDDTTYYTEVEPFKPAERPKIFESIMGRALDPTITTEVYNILETVVSPPRKVESVLGTKKPDWYNEIAEVKTGVGVKMKDESYYSISMGSNAIQEGTNTGEQITLLKNEENDETIGISKAVLITPQFRKIEQTIYAIGILFQDIKNLLKMGTIWWNADNMEAEFTTQDGEIVKCGVLRDLRTSGAENGAVAYWAVNKNYVETINDLGYKATEEDAGGIRGISSKVYKDVAYYTPPVIYKNNKVGYGQAITLMIFSPASGESITKQGYEIRNPEILPRDRMTRANYSIAADIRSGGAPIFAWQYMNGEDQTTSLAETIKGGQWRQIPLAATGQIGSDYEKINLEKEKKSLIKEVAASAGAGALSFGSMAAATMNPYIIGGTAVAGAVYNGAMTFISQTKKQTEQQKLLEATGEIAGVAIQLSNSNYLREIGKNTFYDIFTCYSENDMINFDRFLTLYGYKVNNKKITASDFNSRPNFNYLKLNEVIFKSDKYGIGLLEEAAEQLKAGVRIWHELPNERAIENGNK